MSNMKNFGTQGVASDVQFGKGGGRVAFVDGAFKLIATSTGDELARLAVAEPKAEHDAVSLAFMTTAVNHVYAKLDRNTELAESMLDSLKTSISTLRLDEIAALDTSYTAAVTSAGLTLSSKDHAATLVVDLTQGVTFTAASSEANADIRLVPKGAGSVVIGDGSEDGLIQPDGGHSLTIAGGDADIAGSVIIRGGEGATKGHVEIHDVIDPVDDRDAMTLGAAKTAIAKAAAEIVTGSVRAVVGSFEEMNGDIKIVSVPAGTLMRLKVGIAKDFSAGSTISVKLADKEIASSIIIDQGHVGLYTVELLQDSAGGDLVATVSTTGSGGVASLALEFIAK